MGKEQAKIVEDWNKVAPAPDLSFLTNKLGEKQR